MAAPIVCLYVLNVQGLEQVPGYLRYIRMYIIFDIMYNHTKISCHFLNLVNPLSIKSNFYELAAKF